ncbi:DUF7711 family protein [Amycolatopsis sp. H20-H5]|uniref:DUF7711 family protein n=1 Tax=Amycolatopsis sp. H20-H5 TaxID=3046309 RepID=UPI002DBD1919|nr:hypothetical protein [Amycolatopsis sp. H20-H5]MEC3974096.1 hypothetical protein [Amycolatopsis sp. H20-H5]
MKWATAIRTLKDLALAANQVADSSYTLPVTQLWAAWEILGKPQDDLAWVTVGVVVDLPVDEVAWLTKPRGAEHWEYSTRAAKMPAVTLWRSAHAPVWNHWLDRPAQFWDHETGLAEDVLDALRAGKGEDVRAPAPSEDEFRARQQDDIAVSLKAVRERTRTYEERRWKPGKLTAVSDPLWEATNGYVDLVDGERGE